MCKKLRLVRNNKWEMKTYVKENNAEDMAIIMKTRLNVIELKHNYKGMFKDSTKCPACNEAEDTTEHMLECQRYSRIGNRRCTVEELLSETTRESKKVAAYVQSVMDYREQMGWKINV